MVYLYAGLGVVMLSGIMAIFEMGLSLVGQSMLPTPPDPYQESSEMKLVEKRMIGLLMDRNAVAQGLANQALCDALLQSYAAQYPGESAGQPDGRMPIDQGRWIRSCQLMRQIDDPSLKHISHRVLIMPPDPGQDQLAYRLFSCALTGGHDQCSFERD